MSLLTGHVSFRPPIYHLSGVPVDRCPTRTCSARLTYHPVRCLHHGSNVELVHRHRRPHRTPPTHSAAWEVRDHEKPHRVSLKSSPLPNPKPVMGATR